MGGAPLCGARLAARFDTQVSLRGATQPRSTCMPRGVTHPCQFCGTKGCVPAVLC